MGSSSLTRDRTQVPALGTQSLILWQSKGDTYIPTFFRTKHARLSVGRTGQWRRQRDRIRHRFQQKVKGKVMLLISLPGDGKMKTHPTGLLMP